MERFSYLSQGLAVMLAFIGAKMILAEIVQIPTAVSPGAIIMIVTAAVLLSLWKRRSPAAAGMCTRSSNRRHQIPISPGFPGSHSQAGGHGGRPQ